MGSLASARTAGTAGALVDAGPYERDGLGGSSPIWAT
jgi:hypothetical protein